MISRIAMQHRRQAPEQTTTPTSLSAVVRGRPWVDFGLRLSCVGALPAAFVVHHLSSKRSFKKKKQRPRHQPGFDHTKYCSAFKPGVRPGFFDGR